MDQTDIQTSELRVAFVQARWHRDIVDSGRTSHTNTQENAMNRALHCCTLLLRFRPTDGDPEPDPEGRSG